MNRIITQFAKKVFPQNIRVALRKLNWKSRYILQSTFNPAPKPVYCPLAEKYYKTFIPLRGHLVSPENGARNRQRLVWLYFKNETDIFKKPVRLLHIAPEIATFPIFKKVSTIDYVPGDKMEKNYENQDGVQNVDLTDLKFSANEFDYIIHNHVMEHIPDDRKAIAEMFRVLKPGGKAIITTPIKESLTETYENPNVKTPAEREKHFGQWDHVRYYGLDIENRFKAAGFNVSMIRYGKQFSSEDYTKYGLCDDIIIVATKP